MITIDDIRAGADANPYAAVLVLVVGVILAVSVIYIATEVLWARFGPTEDTGWLDEDTEEWCS